MRGWTKVVVERCERVNEGALVHGANEHMHVILQSINNTST